jgi:hypothetical protein
MTYTDDGISQLLSGVAAVNGEYIALLVKLYSFAQTHPASSEHIVHGFLRRIGTLERCIQNVYGLYAPDRSDIPCRETCVDLAINLQSFVFNVFGCLDNLAWVWVTERSIRGKNDKRLNDTQVGFRKDVVMSSYLEEFRNYVDGLSQWFDYLENFRHALAHRIPLYITPFIVTPDKEASFRDLETQKVDAMRRGDHGTYDELDAVQTGLGVFRPIMTHSLYEAASSPIYFHSQILCDWNTVVEIVDRFFRQPDW